MALLSPFSLALCPFHLWLCLSTGLTLWKRAADPFRRHLFLGRGCRSGWRIRDQYGLLALHLCSDRFGDVAIWQRFAGCTLVEEVKGLAWL